MRKFYALTVDGEINTLGEYETIDKAIESYPEDVVWYFDEEAGLELINNIAKALDNRGNPCLMTHQENEEMKKRMKHDNYMSLLSGLSLLSILRDDKEGSDWYNNMYLEYKEENTPPKDEQ